jgi:hypothetical protein
MNASLPNRVASAIVQRKPPECKVAAELTSCQAEHTNELGRGGCTAGALSYTVSLVSFHRSRGVTISSKPPSRSRTTTVHKYWVNLPSQLGYLRSIRLRVGVLQCAAGRDGQLRLSSSWSSATKSHILLRCPCATGCSGPWWTCAAGRCPTGARHRRSDRCTGPKGN